MANNISDDQMSQQECEKLIRAEIGEFVCRYIHGAWIEWRRNAAIQAAIEAAADIRFMAYAKRRKINICGRHVQIGLTKRVTRRKASERRVRHQSNRYESSDD